ncbi:hypothetical protein M405DRAFT_822900 [Rhizopogon salebrosus TDB-379]|nr:hypothetical protein M405DRAFT_822900 [Rhizopogon salebrosus TDB-379]
MGNGAADIDKEVTALRLNLMVVGSASVIMLGLALHMTGAFDRSRGSRAAVPKAGTLQLLWLGHHSARVHAAMGGVTHPTDANLRYAGLTENTSCWCRAQLTVSLVRLIVILTVSLVSLIMVMTIAPMKGLSRNLEMCQILLVNDLKLSIQIKI